MFQDLLRHYINLYKPPNQDDWEGRRSFGQDDRLNDRARSSIGSPLNHGSPFLPPSKPQQAVIISPMAGPITFEFKTIPQEEVRSHGEALPSVPRRSGVFRIFDVQGKLILLEKTHNLAQRIGRFYSEAREARALDLRDITERVEFCRTDSPLETLYLLHSERRRWFPDTYRTMGTLPRYYLLKINRRQRFPRLYAARQIKRGVAYFGPFQRRKDLERFKAVVERTFRIRPCHYNIRGNDPYPDCLYFQMRTCSKPCNADIGRRAYLEDIDDAIRFVQGGETETLSRMLGRIEELAEETRFEEAERLRRKLDRIKRARKEYREPYRDLWSFDFVAVMESGSVRTKKIALILEGHIVTFEEHKVVDIEETLTLMTRAHRSVKPRAVSPERHYEEFCLVSSFLHRRLESVQLVPLGDPAETAAEIAGILHKAKEKAKRRVAKGAETAEEGNG